jgi:beta-lactam-binding protein with PASTA domain
MLLALGAIGLVAIGILLALLVMRRNDTTSTTVVVTTNPAAHRPTTTAPAAGTARRVAVPDFVGQPAAAAKAKLSRLGLRVVVTPATSTQPAGTIVDQAPAAGTREAKGSVVTLSVARKASTVGTTTAPAATTATTTGSGSTTPAGTTTAAAPAPAPTPAAATMPDVGGQTEQAAVTSLNRASILASLFFVPAGDPLGTIVQQAKQAGTTLPYHAHVQLNVSRGPGQKEDVRVPDVVGSTLTDAVSTLNRANLRLIYVKFPVTSASLIGKIVQQSPLSGGKAPQNAQVLVFLGVRRR